MFPRFSALLLAGTLAVALAAPAFAQALDAPTITFATAGHGKIELTVTAGPSGAPNGFTVYWMTQTDYDNYGDVWPTSTTYPGLNWASFTGVPTLNTGNGLYTSYVLGPSQSVLVEIGDLLDETGLTTNSPGDLLYSSTAGTSYQFCVFANGGTTASKSTISLNAAGTTTLVQNCTFTFGFWKNHAAAWPVTSLTLGTVTYTQTQLLQILGQPAGGNGLISLAHQLIAAKLNILNGADPTAVSSTISSADALIGGLVIPPIGSGFLAPSVTSPLTSTLDDYNNGIIGPGHCNETPARSSTWGSIKAHYR